MRHESKADFHAARAKQERKLAELARDEAARYIHTELAERHEAESGQSSKLSATYD